MRAAAHVMINLFLCRRRARIAAADLSGQQISLVEGVSRPVAFNMQAPEDGGGPFDTVAAAKFIAAQWEQSVLQKLHEFVAIPNRTPQVNRVGGCFPSRPKHNPMVVRCLNTSNSNPIPIDARSPVCRSTHA